MTKKLTKEEEEKYTKPWWRILLENISSQPIPKKILIYFIVFIFVFYLFRYIGGLI